MPSAKKASELSLSFPRPDPCLRLAESTWTPALPPHPYSLPACCDWAGEGQADDKETSSPASAQPSFQPSAQCAMHLHPPCDFVPSPPPRSGKFARTETPLVLPGHFFFFFFFDCAASLALPCPALPWPPLRLRLEPFLVAIDGPVCACAVLRLWVTLTPTRCPRAFVRQVAALPAPAPQRRPVAAGHSTHLAPDPSTRRPLPLPPGPPAVVIVAPSQQATARALKPLRLPRNPPAQ